MSQCMRSEADATDFFLKTHWKMLLIGKCVSACSEVIQVTDKKTSSHE